MIFSKRSLFSVLIFVVIWQVVSSMKLIDVTFIGQPLQVLTEGIALIKAGTIYPYLLSSLVAVIIGFVCAVVISVPIGILFGVKSNLFDYFKPYLYALNATPKIVILPLILLWFGIGLAPKVIFLIIVASIPILVNTIEGTKNTDKKLIEMGMSFSVGRWSLYKNVYFYSAWPYIYSGIRIAFGRTVTNLLIAEIYGLGMGLGYLVSLYGGTFQINKLLFIILLLIIFNFSILAVLDKLNRKFVNK